MKFEFQFLGISPTHSHSAIMKQLPLEQSICLSTDVPGSRRPVDFSGGPVAKTPPAQRTLMQKDSIPHWGTRSYSLHAAIKDLTCHN